MNSTILQTKLTPQQQMNKLLEAHDSLVTLLEDERMDHVAWDFADAARAQVMNAIHHLAATPAFMKEVAGSLSEVTR